MCYYYGGKWSSNRSNLPLDSILVGLTFDKMAPRNDHRDSIPG
jgi:hypothetical protein